MNNNRASTIKDYVASLAAPSIGEAFRPGGFTPSRRLLSLGFTIADLIEVRLSAELVRPLLQQSRARDPWGD